MYGREKEIYTSDSRRNFSRTTPSWTDFNLLYSSSSFLFFQRALRFWNQTATWRGSSPSSEASRSFLSDSSLCSLPKLSSRRLACSWLSFLFLAPDRLFSPPLFFFRRRRGFDSPAHHIINKLELIKHDSKMEKNSMFYLNFYHRNHLAVVQFECIHQGTFGR